MTRLLKKTTALAALVAALCAIAAPMASARFDLNPPTQTSAPAAQVPFAPATPKTTSSGSFSWGDAAIGAGAALLIVAVAGAAAVAVRHGRARQPAAS
jgi:hypothetical protein